MIYHNRLSSIIFSPLTVESNDFFYLLWKYEIHFFNKELNHIIFSPLTVQSNDFFDLLWKYEILPTNLYS